MLPLRTISLKDMGHFLDQIKMMVMMAVMLTMLVLKVTENSYFIQRRDRGEYGRLAGSVWSLVATCGTLDH